MEEETHENIVTYQTGATLLLGSEADENTGDTIGAGIDMLKRAANGGSAKAAWHMYILASLDDNDEDSLDYLKRAAALKWPDALYELGKLYIWRSPQEISDKGKVMLAEAAELGCPRAVYHKWFLSDDRDEDIDSLIKAAELGHLQAMRSLAFQYRAVADPWYAGELQLPYYEPNGEVYWLRKAAETGDPESIMDLMVHENKFGEEQIDTLKRLSSRGIERARLLLNLHTVGGYIA